MQYNEIQLHGPNQTSCSQWPYKPLIELSRLQPCEALVLEVLLILLAFFGGSLQLM